MRRNRRNLDKYLRDIYAMEKLARIQENISILKTGRLKRKPPEKDIKSRGLWYKDRDFVLVSFPGEAVGK